MPQKPTGLPPGVTPIEDDSLPPGVTPAGQVNIGQNATYTANGVPEPSLATQAVNTAADVGKGALKGLASSAIGAGQLVTKAPGVAWSIDHLYGLFGMPVDTRKALADALLQPEVTPTNAPQKVGKALEQVGEFFALPTGKAGLVSKMVTQGAGSALLSGVQGATAPEAGVVGAIGAAMPALGAAASTLAPALKDTASSLVEKGLGATKERFKAMGAKLAPDVLDRDLIGWFGTSRPALLEKASAQASQAGKAVDAELAKVGGNSASTDLMIQGIEDAKKPYQITRTLTPQEMATRPDLAKNAIETSPGVFETTLPIDKRPINALTQLQKTLTDLGPDATIDQTVAVRRVWDQIVDQAGGYAQRSPGAIGVPLKEQAEAWAKKQGADSIRRVLSSDAPSIADVNKEYHFWRGLQDVVNQTLQRTTPQTGNIGKDIMTAAGAVGGAASGGGVPAAVSAGYAARVLNAAFKSPRWAFIKAKYADALSDALMSGSQGQLNSVASKIELGLANQGVQAVGGR